MAQIRDHCPNLRSFRFHPATGTRFTNIAFQQLVKALPNLTHFSTLAIEGDSKDGSVWAQLAGLPSLQSVLLYNEDLSAAVADTIVRSVRHPFPALATLRCHIHTPAIATLFPLLPHLVEVDLDFEQRTVDTLSLITKSCPQLLELEVRLPYCESQDFRSVADNCKELRSFEISTVTSYFAQGHLPLLRDTDIEYFAQRMPDLNFLYIDVEKDTTMTAFRILGRHCRHLEFITIRVQLDLAQLDKEDEPLFPKLTNLQIIQPRALPVSDVLIEDEALPDHVGNLLHNAPRTMSLLVGNKRYNLYLLRTVRSDLPVSIL